MGKIVYNSLFDIRFVFGQDSVPGRQAMDEYQGLAVAAVQALQAANQPKWTEVASVVITALVGLAQCGLIGYGLWLMRQTGERRDRQLDRQEQALEDIGAGIREQSAGIRAAVAGIERLLERRA